MKQIIKKYIFGIIAVIIYFGLKLYSPEIFPDLLKLASINSNNYFALLLSATASVFGIVVAVILLTFEFLKHTSYRYKEESLFTKSVVTNLVSIAVSIIVLSLISYISIQDLKTPNNLSIAYFMGFLFVGFIISIFPATKGILETANTLKKTKEDIQKLTLEQFKEILTSQNDKFLSKKSSLVLVRIRQELLNFVRECDYEAYTSLIEELNNKSINLIGKGGNRQTTEIVFRGTSFIWNAGNFEALRVGNYQYYNTVWECIEELYEYAAKKKIYLLHFEFLDFFIKDFIKFLSRNKLGDSLSSGVKVFSNVFKQNLKYNCPPQEQINSLYFIFDKTSKKPHFPNSNIQWNKINNFISRIQYIQTSAIEIVDKELYDTCRVILDSIVSSIGNNYFSKLKTYQEAFIVRNIISHQVYNASIAIEKEPFKESMWTFHIDIDFISDIIKNEKFYVGIILENISDFIIKSQRQKSLDDFITLNDWCALGRFISADYLKNKTAQKTMGFIIDTLEILKNEIEENQLPNQAKNYNEIKEQLESLKTWLLKDNVGKEILLINRINELIDNFQEVSGISNFRIIKWKED